MHSMHGPLLDIILLSLEALREENTRERISYISTCISTCGPPYKHVWAPIDVIGHHHVTTIARQMHSYFLSDAITNGMRQ